MHATESPPINDFNPTGERFIHHPTDDIYGAGKGPSAYQNIYRWDPPGGYNLVAVVRGMQGVYARDMARQLCEWLNKEYPL